jgi:hypothetical protein
VRLEMRSVVGMVATVPALLLSVACCCKAPFIVGDTISGGPDGYPFVKVVITLSNNAAGKCHVADAQPETVYVFPGSAIRWRINNLCDKTTGSPRLLTFTSPVPGAHGKSGAVAATPATPATQTSAARVGYQASFDFANCSSKVALGPDKDPANVLLCEIPENVVPGFYKYGLGGDIEPYDPGLEVRPGGK